MTRYLEILAEQRPFQIGVDENDRVQFSCNFTAMAEAPVGQFESDIAALLVAAGLAVLADPGAPNGDLFIGWSGTLPVGDGPYTHIFNTAPYLTYITHNNTACESLAFQLITRALSYTAAHDRAVAMWRLLHGIRNTVVS